MNVITAIVVGTVVGVVGLLIVNAVIEAGNFTGVEATLLGILPLILVAVILFIGIRGLTV
jgi:hypothetical protein